MESPVGLILAMITFATVTAYGQTIYMYASDNPVAVGSNITLFSWTKFTTGVWLFNGDILVFVHPGDTIIDYAWSDRVTYNSTISSVTIRSIRLEDSGLYSLQALNSFRGQLTLSVQVPISNVTLRTTTTNLVEFNDTAVLMCSVSNGSFPSYTWLKGNAVIAASGGVQLSDGGATLTIVRVTRYDNGPFRCNVSNGVSHEISLPVHLNISYGPSNATVMPMMYTYRSGSNITLSCSAESNPPAMIQWTVDGVLLHQFGSQIQLQRVTESHSGNYQCLLYNTVTLKNNSASAMIKILEPIARVVVNHTGGPAILHEPSTLTCEVTGPVDKIEWWRNGQLISADSTIVFEVSNSTLILSPVQLSDRGDYQCMAFNSVSNMTSSPYTVEVNFGPETPIIHGPAFAETGHYAAFQCEALSVPPSQVSWWFNGSNVANTSVFETGLLLFNMSGEYTCMAYNYVTGKNSTNSKMLTVIKAIESVTIRNKTVPVSSENFTLTCEVIGPYDMIFWKKDNMVLNMSTSTANTQPNHTQNNLLDFTPVTKNNDGKYQCVAVNQAGQVESPQYMLLVNYGPEMPTTMGPNLAKTGHIVTLSCNASSNPLSFYKWFFNDSVVANTSEYVTRPLTTDMSGMYTCMAYNSITGRNSTAYTMLTVVAIDVQVEAPKDPAIEGHLYMLKCNESGHAERVYWMKNGEALHEDNRTVFDMVNKTVTFNPLRLSDNGDYQCIAVYAIWNMSSPPYKLIVNYGPLNVSISGPDSAKVGVAVFLTCSADCWPKCDFYWFLNNRSSTALQTGSVFTFSTTKKNEGNYICKAMNPVTNITAYQTKAITVTAHASALCIPSQGGLMSVGLFALSVRVLFN